MIIRIESSVSQNHPPIRSTLYDLWVNMEIDMEEETIIDEIVRKMKEGKLKQADRIYGKCRSRTTNVVNGEGQTVGYKKK